MGSVKSPVFPGEQDERLSPGERVRSLPQSAT